MTVKALKCAFSRPQYPYQTPLPSSISAILIVIPAKDKADINIPREVPEGYFTSYEPLKGERTKQATVFLYLSSAVLNQAEGINMLKEEAKKTPTPPATPTADEVDAPHPKPNPNPDPLEGDAKAKAAEDAAKATALYDTYANAPTSPKSMPEASITLAPNPTDPTLTRIGITIKKRLL